MESFPILNPLPRHVIFWEFVWKALRGGSEIPAWGGVGSGKSWDEPFSLWWPLSLALPALLLCSLPKKGQKKKSGFFRQKLRHPCCFPELLLLWGTVNPLRAAGRDFQGILAAQQGKGWDVHPALGQPRGRLGAGWELPFPPWGLGVPAGNSVLGCLLHFGVSCSPHYHPR